MQAEYADGGGSEVNDVVGGGAIDCNTIMSELLEFTMLLLIPQ